MAGLAELGWGPAFSRHLALPEEAGLPPARVAADFGARLLLALGGEERLATAPSSLRGAIAVGDWVLCEPRAGGEALVRRVLPRRTLLSRQAAGRRTEEQLLAANVDLAFVVQGLDGDRNLRRLERTVAAIRASGAEAAVLLNKADLLADPAEAVAEARAALPSAAVAAISARHRSGLEAVRGLLGSGRTGVFLGSSGAGKSTLVNALLGEAVQATQEVRAADARGRHTTSHRQLFLLPGGGMVIDGPGLRELQLWEGAGVAPTFEDVAALAAACRFTDCRHLEEPGCAVRRAVEEGALAPGRLDSFQKLAGEARALAGRHDVAARQEATRQARILARARRDVNRRRGR